MKENLIILIDKNMFSERNLIIMNPNLLSTIDYYRNTTCRNCDNQFFQRESLLVSYCNYCSPFIVESRTKNSGIKVFSDYSKEKLELENKKLERNNLNLKKEILELEGNLEIERTTNLEMLENLKVLNEEKLTKSLQIRNEEIDNLNEKIKFLEQKFNELEDKYSQLIIENS